MRCKSYSIHQGYNSFKTHLGHTQFVEEAGALDGLGTGNHLQLPVFGAQRKDMFRRG